MCNSAIVACIVCVCTYVHAQVLSTPACMYASLCVQSIVFFLEEHVLQSNVSYLRSRNVG